MASMKSRSTMLRHAAAGAAALALLAGCGSETGPQEAVPELGTRLEAVDAAVVEGNWEQARSELEALIARADAAEQAGDISSEEADRIRAAATRLLEQLPEEPATQEPETPEEPEEPAEEAPEETEEEPEEPEEQPEETEDPGEGDDDDQGQGNDDDQGQGNDDNQGQGNDDNQGKGNEDKDKDEGDSEKDQHTGPPGD